MKIGLLIIASEILEGKISDLNGKILTEFLSLHHHELNEIKIIRDNLQEIKDSISLLDKNHDLIIISGGLGPTEDDLTKVALSHFLGKNIIFSDVAFQIATENYERFSKIYPGKTHPYSFVPEGVTALSNSTGFAPGLWFSKSNPAKSILCAQGVPREFKSTLEDHLTPFLKRLSETTELQENITYRTKNIPEEKIFNELDVTLWKKLSEFGSVSSLPVLMGVDIGIKVKAKNQNELIISKEKIHQIIKNSPVSKYIWANQLVSLEEKIIQVASLKNITFSFAESCSGGLCSHRITNVSGSSQVFWGSVVCYDESVKKNILGVSVETLKTYGAVSSQTALEMASGVKRILKTHIGISLTGLAGPGGGSEENPVGTVYMGVNYFNQQYTEVFHLKGHRQLLKERFSQVALYKLLEILEEFPMAAN